MSKAEHLFPYRWNMADGYPAKGIQYHGRKVFGTFICGGGSTMGYKLAGYDHLGGVEIDPKVAAVYKANHKPKHLYVEDIRAFNERTDLPDELFNLDLLDGSPPCSSFSMAGSREKGWGKAKVFREGQAHQRLDDLVFAYVDTIAKLKPKVAILENVKGIIAGNAKVYAKEIVRRLREHGYTVQVFLLNAATMGVPQMRERVFFIARLNAEWPDLVLSFNEPPIPFGKVFNPNDKREPLSPSNTKRWHVTPVGLHPKAKTGNNFGFLTRASHNKVAPTILSGQTFLAMQDTPEDASEAEYRMIGSYPNDYNFQDIPQKYLIGMSVPPVMMAQIAHQINLQWFSPSK
jgi:DNA (cytosine-5)-methyltransferase 1